MLGGPADFVGRLAEIAVGDKEDGFGLGHEMLRKCGNQEIIEGFFPDFLISTYVLSQSSYLEKFGRKGW
jgi:hypothetical protein